MALLHSAYNKHQFGEDEHITEKDISWEVISEVILIIIFLLLMKKHLSYSFSFQKQNLLQQRILAARILHESCSMTFSIADHSGSFWTSFNEFASYGNFSSSMISLRYFITPIIEFYIEYKTVG